MSALEKCQEEPISTYEQPKEQSAPWYSPSYFLRTLWLFTVSDHKTFVYPQTLFGIFSALSGPILTTNDQPVLLTILSRIPSVLLWTWLNTLVFVLANQRLPDAVTEDALNKPWRPIPAGRMNMAHTRRLLLVAAPLSYGAIYYLGGKDETLLLFCLTWMYNDLGGSDEHYAIRNGIIAVAYALYSAGAMRVACGFDEFDLNTTTYIWLAMVVSVIFTTMQVQDLKDQEGDRARGRSTAPLDFGDGTARWMVAFPVLAWSALCPAFWGLGLFAYAVTGGLGLTVSLRVLLLRNFAADVLTWKLWALWLTALYCLPLMRDYSIFLRFWASLSYA